MVVGNKKNLTDIIETALCQTPGAIGKRLRSETELATMMNVGRWKMRNSLDQLVEKGVLVRRQGSGTYVRKMPEKALDYSEKNQSYRDIISAEKFFADPATSNASSQPTLQPMRQQKSLHLGLWSGMYQYYSASNQLILAGITGHLSQLGHYLSIHTLMARPYVTVTIPEAAQMLQNNPSDGYMVAAAWIDLFTAAIGNKRAPVVFFADEYFRANDKHLLCLDTNEEIRRAVHLLALEGYQRIALVALKPFLDKQQEKQDAYEEAMRKAGLNYRKSFFLDLGQCLNALNETLNQVDRPDAIFVADDNFMPEVVAAMTMSKIVPGQDLGVIVQSNARRPLPVGYDWSRLEFDLEAFGIRVVDDMMRIMQSVDIEPYSTAIHSVWKPGQTHKKQ